MRARTSSSILCVLCLFSVVCLKRSDSRSVCAPRRSQTLADDRRSAAMWVGEVGAQYWRGSRRNASSDSRRPHTHNFKSIGALRQSGRRSRPALLFKMLFQDARPDAVRLLYVLCGSLWYFVLVGASLWYSVLSCATRCYSLPPCTTQLFQLL